MNLPKKIKVGNITYKVILGGKLQKELDEMVTEGYHCSTEQSIVISNRLTPEMTRNTFFHELTHSILYQIGAVNENENEVLVQSLANELDKLFELKK